MNIICKLKGHEPPKEVQNKLSLTCMVIITTCIKCKKSIIVEQDMSDEDCYLVSESEGSS